MPHDETGSGADLSAALPPAVRALASGERSDPQPADKVGTFSYATVLRNEPPGWWGTDVWEQVNNYKGAVALAVRPIMTAFRGGEYKVLRRKAKSVQKAQGGRHKWSRDDDYEPVEDHPLCDIIRAPGGPQGAWSFGYECAYAYLQYLLTGNAAIWFPANADGKPCQMFALSTTSVQVAFWPGANSNYPQGAYRVLPYATGAGFGSMGYMTSTALLPGEQVRILREPDPLSRQLGRSRLRMGAMEIDVLKSINEFRWNYFDTGVALDTVVSLPGASESDIKRVGEVLTQKHGGARNARRLAVFGGAAGIEGGKGATIQNLSPNAKDLDFPNGFEQALGQVLAFFGVPKILAGFDDSANYATYIGQKRRFYQECLLPEFAGLSEFLTKHLAEPWSDEPGEYVIVCEPEVPEDLEAEQQRKQFEATNNLITYNQYLKGNNYPPVPDGDVPLQIYLAKLQQQVAPPPQPGMDPNAPPGSEQEAAVPGAEGDQAAPMPPEGDDSEQGTQDATLQAALAALGMGDTDAGPVAKGFDPNEARDDHGRWTSGGGADKSPHEVTRNEFVAKNGSRSESFDEARVVALTEPNSTHSQIIHGREELIGEVPRFHSVTYRNGREQKWTLRIYKNASGNLRYLAFPLSRDGQKVYDNLVEGGVQVEVKDGAPPKVLTAAASSDVAGSGLAKAIIRQIETDLGEWVPSYPMSGQGAKFVHQMKVESAVAQGKQVPPEVLSDYPKLAERFKKAAAPVDKPGSARSPHRAEGEIWTTAGGKRYTKRNGKIVPAPQQGGSGAGGPASKPAGQAAPAPAQPQQPSREQIHAAILKTKGAKAFGFTAETLAKMHPDAVSTVAAQLGISKPEQHYAKHAAAVPVTPRSQPVLQRAGEWADAMAQKHAARVAQRLGIRPELAQRILAKAIRQVAEHALKSGGKASGTLTVGGQSVRLGVGAKTGAGAAPSKPPTPREVGLADAQGRPTNPAERKRPRPGIEKAMSAISDPDGGFLVPPAGNMPRRKRKRRSVCAVVRKALKGVA